MKEAKKAAFSFEKYQIKKFAYDDASEDFGNSLSIGFHPSGVYFESSGKFVLSLKFEARLESSQEGVEDHTLVKAELEASFIFQQGLPFNEIPSYFYRNSLGIVFPYLRAFISTLTFQAAVHKPIVLPILNLVDLEMPFKENTIIHDHNASLDIH